MRAGARRAQTRRRAGQAFVSRLRRARHPTRRATRFADLMARATKRRERARARPQNAASAFLREIGAHFAVGDGAVELHGISERRASGGGETIVAASRPLLAVGDVLCFPQPGDEPTSLE